MFAVVLRGPPYHRIFTDPAPRYDESFAPRYTGPGVWPVSPRCLIGIRTVRR